MEGQNGKYQILLPVDTNEQRARRAAETVAALPGDSAEITVVVLNVFEDLNTTDEGPMVRSSELYDQDAFPESIEIVIDVLEDTGINVRTRRERGEPADKIVAVAEEIDADSIVMSGRRRSPVGKALFGSVTQSVLLATDRPVTSVLSE